MGDLATSPHVEEKKKNYFGKLRFAAKLVGVSLDGNESVGYKIYSCLLIFFLNILYTFLDTLEMFKYDFETVANFIVFPFGMMMALGKTLVFRRNRNKIAKLLDKLEQEPFLPNSNRGGQEEEDKLMKDCLWIINTQSLVYWLSALTCGGIGFLWSLTTRIKSSDYHDWKLSYGPLTALNVTYSPNYEATALYQNITAFVAAIQFSTCDMIIAGVLTYISFQFKMLQNFMRRIVEISYVEMLKETEGVNAIPNSNGSDDDEIDGSLVPWKYLKKHLAEGVTYHLSILSVAGEMEDLFNGLLLYVFLNSIGLLCPIVFNAARPGGLFWLLVGGIGVVAGQLFTNCFWGEQVIHESQEVGRAAYESNSVGTDLRFQKALSLIIRRSQKPTVLTAGKFAVVCLSTFTWILKVIYSTSAAIKQLIH